MPFGIVFGTVVRYDGFQQVLLSVSVIDTTRDQLLGIKSLLAIYTERVFC